MNDMIVIVFTINNKFAVPTYITIQSLFQYAGSTTSYECIILSNDLKKRNQKLILELARGTTHKIIFKKVDSSSIHLAKITYSWPEVVYYRLYLCDILKSYDKIIFSDVDVLIQGDLSNVWNTDIRECEIAAVAAEINCNDAQGHLFYKENTHKYIYWDGFMLMNLKLMRQKSWIERCNKNLELFRSKLFMCDLEIINISANKIVRLPLRYVFLQSLYYLNNIEDAEEYRFLKRIYTIDDIRNERDNVVIIHYAGKMGKPWLSRACPTNYRIYLEQLPYSLKIQNIYNRLYTNLRVLTRNIYRMTLKPIKIGVFQK